MKVNIFLILLVSIICQVNGALDLLVVDKKRPSSLGWCPQTEYRPQPFQEYLLDPYSNQHACDAKTVDKAGQIALEGIYRGEYEGFPGGQCGFVKVQLSCESMGLINFKELYYCTL